MSKNVGILFADISGSTRLFRKGNSEEGQYQLERCIKRIERSIQSNRGELMMPAADEMIALFSTADDAVLAAVDMQRRIEDMLPVSGVRLTIRIGLHFGPVVESLEGLVGSAVDSGRALLNLAGAGQIVTCEQTAVLLKRPVRDLLKRIESLEIATQSGDSQVYQVLWQEDTADSVGCRGKTVAEVDVPSSEKKPKCPERIVLRLGDRALLIDSRTPKARVGRDKECSLILKGSKVSRFHAEIEWRAAGTFVLVDSSTNGTYLMKEGGSEKKVHRETVFLSGRGKLAFGHTTEQPDSDVIDFEVI